MVISSRVVACTSQPVAFNGHPSTGGRLTGLRNKPQQKKICQHLAVVYWKLVSLLMELSIDGENCSLTWSGVRKWQVLARQVTLYPLTSTARVSRNADDVIIYRTC